MKLHRVAFWTRNIEAMEEFYKSHFKGETLFKHSDGDFRCKFIKIIGGIKIELMNSSNIPDAENKGPVGYSYISLECESKEQMDKLTEYFQEHGIPLNKIKEQYDDGFYESSVKDPDGNIIELAYIDRVVNSTG